MALAMFNKLPFTEEMKSIYLNLGLDFENRGLPQKAYLVYKKVFDVDPGFEDLVQRMERLGQAGVSGSLFSAAVPTALAGRSKAIVRAQVLANGQVGEAFIKQTSGAPMLDQAALATVRAWRFRPARRNGEPVPAWVNVPIAYRNPS